MLSVLFSVSHFNNLEHTCKTVAHKKKHENLSSLSLFFFVINVNLIQHVHWHIPSEKLTQGDRGANNTKK